MKNKKIITLILTLSLLASFATFTLIAHGESTADSNALVTVGYLNKVLSSGQIDVSADVDAAVQESLAAETEKITKQLTESLTETLTEQIYEKVYSDITKNLEGNPASADTSYEIVELDVGQKLIGKGTTEIIVRSGEAVSVCPGENGLSDLTGGTDIAGGISVPLNHLVVIPRDDGRGVSATKTSTFIMVRGAYEIA